jgi:excisionase family DNA binding protein
VKTASSSAPALVSIEDAMQILSIGRTTLYALINEGKIYSRRIGRRRLVLAESLYAYAKQGDQ